jgi:hypothetical protein
LDVFNYTIVVFAWKNVVFFVVPHMTQKPENFNEIKSECFSRHNSEFHFDLSWIGFDEGRAREE